MSNETLTEIIRRAELADSLADLRTVVVELALALRQMQKERDFRDGVRNALSRHLERER